MKIIVFDFDGTLTKKSENIWKALWSELGYPLDKESYFAYLYTSFVQGKFTHQEWCDLTAHAFIKRNMNTDILKKLGGQINLIGNFNKTLNILKENGYKMYIASGNIKQVVEIALGKNVQYFEAIKANGMTFDENGNLQNIIGTQYDFKGKKEYVLELAKQFNIDPKEIVFVGNGDNDEFVAETDCKTICINAEKTGPNNKNIWKHNAGETDDLSQILQFISINESFVEL